MSNENPITASIDERIAAIQEAQQPTRDQITELQAQLTDGEQEVRRLEAAKEILEGSATVTRARATSNGGPRRPRGEVKQSVLDYIAKAPGATAAQVASATGSKKPSTASTLQKLVSEGLAERVMLPGNGVGFRPKR